MKKFFAPTKSVYPLFSYYWLITIINKPWEFRLASQIFNWGKKLIIFSNQIGRYPLTEQSFTERSTFLLSLGKRGKFKKVNVFLRFKGFKFIFSTFVKRKNTSFICGEHRVWKFRKINSSLYVQAVFWRFSPFLKEILKGAKKSLKNAINQTIWIFLSKFLCSMFTADKRHVFSFHENRKNQLKAFKTQKPIHFLKFPTFP